MFRERKNPTPPTLYDSLEQLLNTHKRKELHNPNAWHNLFRQHVTFAIDEKPFAVLFDENNGCPNASIRVLLAMMILKEGYGWSDEELFNQCRFNLLLMNALGLSNITDDVPVESTYYELRRKIYEYQVVEGVDLAKGMYEDLTKKQSDEFSVCAKWIRMDSKLIGSNIANCSRLQLIISCIQEFYKSLDESSKIRLNKEDIQTLESLENKKASQVVYRLSNREKEKYLEKLGWLIDRIIRIFNDNDSNKYKMIKRLFEEQYSRGAEKVELKPGKDIPAYAIQSAYDTEAVYRNKNGNKVKGYSVNLTETCNAEGLNLITGIEVESANTPDTEFLRPGVEQTERIAGEVKEISVDGAYNSKDNHEYSRDNNKDLHLSGIQGAKGKYEYERISKNKVRVTDTENGEVRELVAYKDGKYKIKESKGKTRYFKDEHVESSQRRKEVEDIAPYIRKRRCNVEASIFQECYHLRKDKVRYRGRYKTKLWATCRGLWINLVRIKNYVGELCSDSPQWALIYN